MRILFIVHRVPYPPNKGEKLRAFWELQELSKQHTVDLFCFYDDPEDYKHARMLSKYCHRYCLEKISFWGSRARAIAAVLSGRPFSPAFYHSPRMAKRIALALRSGYYDRVMVYSSSMAQYAQSTEGIPKLLDLVDVDSDKWRQYSSHSSWPWSWLWRREAQLLGAYESDLVRAFAATVVCTDAEYKLLRSQAPAGHISTLENFFDVEAYTPQHPLPDCIRALQPYVLFSGSMDYRPNIDAVKFFCCDVFPAIRREVPEIRFVIAGRNPHRSIVALKDDWIKVTGNVSDMKPYIWGAAVAVAPMRIARGVQTKILEALAGGISVVSSTAAASALSPSLRSLLTVADTPQEMSAAVVRLFRDSAISSQHLRATVKDYFDHLDLPSRLQKLVSDPAGQMGKEEETNRQEMITTELGVTPSWQGLSSRAG